MSTPGALVRQRMGMRREQGLVSGRARTGIQRNIVAPVGGLNTRDALGAMPATDAWYMVNWLPSTGSVDLRPGFTSYAALAAEVFTLAEFNGGAATKFIAATVDTVYNITTGGSPASLGTGFTNGRWQTWNFNGRLFLANGADTLQIYDGTTLGNSTFSGPTLANVIGGNSFKNRVYVWEKDSQDFWYGGVNSIAGAMTQFPLSRVGNFGGKLLTMVNWTIDGGNGPDDYAAFFMSTGEVIVYSGSDPGSATAWSLVGVFRIPPPIGRRSAIKFAGDIVVQSAEDYLLMSEVLRANTKRTKMTGAAEAAFKTYSGNEGWQAIYFPTQGWGVFNIPISATKFDQHILNAVTNAWTTFSGLDARCWGVYGDDLYFGGATGVFRIGGTNDNGADVLAEARQSWNGMGVAELKRFTAFRVIAQSDGLLNYTAGLAYDYGSVGVTTVASIASPGTPWGSVWGSAWSPAIQIKQDWQVAAGIGNEVSLRLRIDSRGQNIRWLRTDYLFERGGVL